MCVLIMLGVILVIPLKALDTTSKPDSVLSSEQKFDIIIRGGQGGFQDSRSPINKLGGGQLAIDIRNSKLPVGISISNEYYTNGPGPTNSYEISSMTGVNFLYYKEILKEKRLSLFAGGGLGGMNVPQGVDSSARSMFYDFEAGFNTRLIWKFGIYGMYKYLYANKENQIDFSEHIIMLGLTFNFSL